MAKQKKGCGYLITALILLIIGGVVAFLGIKGAGNQRTMTVRRVVKGQGVEKIFPLSSPNVTKVEVVKKARVRRGKLGFLRQGYKKRLKETKVEEENK